MENKMNEVKQSIYAGMSIYKEIMNCQIKIDNKKISLEDKKILSLYLGIVSTNNEVSNFLNLNNIYYNIQVKYETLNFEEYLEIYNDNFTNIFREIDFENIFNYFEYLLNNPIIKKYNEANNNNIKLVTENKNKILVKQ